MRPNATMILALTALCGIAPAGPIDPPPGPVQSTMKTLDQVEPRVEINALNTPGDNDATPSVYKIAQPGSYYLTHNLAGQAGKLTIEIACDNVTIDLCGHAVLGGLIQIAAAPAQGDFVRNVTLRNGSLSGEGGNGVQFDLAQGALVESVTVTGNGTGIRLGPGGLARDCTAQGCVQGFQAVGGAAFVSCQAPGNSEIGFLALHPGATFTACTASDNGKTGFYVVEAVLEGCSATGNGEYGFGTNTSCVLRGCRASHNAQGGIISWGAAEVLECTSHANGATGIQVGVGSVVQGCNSTRNDFHGIEAAGGCRITGNTCSENGQASGSTGSGVLVAGGGNRVEGNHVRQNEKGITTYPGAVDNFIAGNTAHANPAGNFNIGAGNELAPVVSNPGSNNFSTATPWSNFSL